MLPILFSFGPLTISSFGVFMALGLLTALYFIWKLSNIEELNLDQSTNLLILCFLSSLIGARLVAVILNQSVFDTFIKILDLNRYPALSFWGGLISGLIFLIIYCNLKNINLWKILDLAAIGAWIGIALGDLGCFLGGCGYGLPSNAWFTTEVSGLANPRIPVSLLESLILLILFPLIWKKALRFHEDGSIFAKSLMIIGILKLILENLRGDRIYIFTGVSIGLSIPLVMIISSLFIQYTKLKRNPAKDLKFLSQHLTSAKRRALTLSLIQKYWYNQSVTWKIRAQKSIIFLQKLGSNLKRRLNVKSTPKQYR